MSDFSNKPNTSIPSDPIENYLPNHKTPKKWYLTFAIYIIILTFISGATFSAGFLTALSISDNTNDKGPNLNNILNNTSSQTSIVKNQPIISKNEDGSIISTIAETVSPSIITIVNYSNRTSDLPKNMYYDATGSGIIFKASDDELFIVTNHHVINGSDGLDIIFHDGSISPAKVVGFNSRMDIAVLSVPLYEIDDSVKPISIAILGDSDTIKIGETVVAIGNPLGPEYTSTVTSGIISAIGRSIDLNPNSSHTNLIQTDAAISPGNSGGALLNSRGEVIGINSIKFVDESIEGIGFAIPINDTKRVIELIFENPNSKDLAYELSDDRAFLGVQIQDISPEIYDDTGMRNGVYVTSVFPHSSAESAGIKEGDIIYLIDKQRIRHVSSLFNALEQSLVGDELDISLLRDGDIIEVKAMLTSYKTVMEQQ